LNVPARRYALVFAWGALIALAAGVWFVTGTRISYRLGLDAAAPAIGVIVSAAVATTIWRWGRADREVAALAQGACPRCHAPVVEHHEHARPGSAVGGVTAWRCADCGFERIETLTCERCTT
jgi:hypothetical protein